MVSASIVLYNTDLKMLKEVIDSFLIGEGERKLFLVDNSPTDKLKNVVNLYSDKIDYHYVGKNIGYGAGHNIAIKKSMDECFTYHVVLNPDLSFDPNIIDTLTEFMEEHKRVGLCIPDMYDYYTGERKSGARLLPSPLDCFARGLLTKYSITQKRNRAYMLLDADYTKPFNAPYISGSFMFFRNSCLKEIGLFDERFFMYFEDTDISRRMYERFENSYVPYAKAKHVGARETYKSKRMLWITIRSACYYFNKYGWLFDRERKRINKEVLLKSTSSL